MATKLFTKKESSVEADLTTLLKKKLPSVFEREPAQAYAEGNLKNLVNEIIEVCRQ